MKKGLEIGTSLHRTVEVTKEMVAQFEGEVVHEVYSTVSMVYHMEWVSRELVLPYLEDEEEGMGAAVSVKHISPSGVGTQIEVKAIVIDMNEREVVTEVTVKNECGVIGKGEVKQAILEKGMLQMKLQKQTASQY